MLRNEKHISIVRELLRKKSKKASKLQPQSMMKFLDEMTDMDHISLSDSLCALKESGELICDQWSERPFAPLKMVELNLKPIPLGEHEIEWIEILNSSQLSDDEIDALIPIAPKISDLSKKDKERLLQALIDFKSKTSGFIQGTSFIVSAQHFLGSSKLLSNLKKDLKRFGIDYHRFDSNPQYIVAAGPAEPAAVILVENPNSFELAIDSGGVAEKCVWICTYGYGLSMNKNPDEVGNQLACHIESINNVKTLIRKGTPPSIKALLNHPNIYFWGDLDLEGLKILTRLKKVIPNIQLSALYQPMLSMLSRGVCHPYARVFSKERQKLWASESSDIQYLINLCSDSGVDQESVTHNYIESLSTSKLDLNQFKLWDLKHQ